MSDDQTEIDGEVDLSAYEDEDLIDECVNRAWVAPDFADQLLDALEGASSHITTATDYLRGGQITEALIRLERALPREWDGVLTRGRV